MTRLFAALLSCAIMSFSHAGTKPAQLEFNRIRQGDQTLLSYVWLDSKGNQQYIKASVDTGVLLRSSRLNRKFRPSHFNSHIVHMLRKTEAEMPPGINLRIVSSRYNYAVDITGGDPETRLKAKQMLAQKIAFTEQQYFADRHLTKTLDGYGQSQIITDHLFFARASIEPLAPLIANFHKQVNQFRPHTALDRIIGFVQAIPAQPAEANDAAYMPPPTVLFDNIGSADAKAALAVALIRGTYPARPLALVYLKEHTLLATQLNYDVDGKWFSDGEQKWLPMEIAGPDVLPIGQISEKTERELNAQTFKIVPVP